VQWAWNSDRLAVLLFLLALSLTVGLTVGLAAGSVVWGVISGFGSVLVGAVVLWAFLRGPLARIAADAMHRISGR
jgi:hypothetical protein